MEDNNSVPQNPLTPGVMIQHRDTWLFMDDYGDVWQLCPSHYRDEPLIIFRKHKWCKPNARP